ncbi:MAG: LysM peptidoglycan-binding domain-containing protein [Actinobacteria bacterium]|nr:LysM peptidoglycan-binding domain-containing protein [Actinomycetota bacterium]
MKTRQSTQSSKLHDSMSIRESTRGSARPSSPPSNGIAILSFASLLALLLAVPIILIEMGGLPSIPEVVHVITNPGRLLHAFHGSVSGIVVLRIFEVACWLGWLWFIGCLAAESAARLAHKPARHIPGSRRMQSFAACLIGLSMGILPLARHADTGNVIRLHALQSSEVTCLFQDTGSHIESVNAGSSNRSTGKPADKPTNKSTGHSTDKPGKSGNPGDPGKSGNPGYPGKLHTEPANYTVSASANDTMNMPGHENCPETSTGDLPIELTNSSISINSSINLDNSMSILPPDNTASKPPRRIYTVLPGDSLWSIAKKELGSGSRWREIALLNEGRLQPGGEIFGQSKWVLPGWQLAMPINGHIADMAINSNSKDTMIGQSGNYPARQYIHANRKNHVLNQVEYDTIAVGNQVANDAVRGTVIEGKQLADSQAEKGTVSPAKGTIIVGTIATDSTTVVGTDTTDITDITDTTETTSTTDTAATDPAASTTVVGTGMPTTSSSRHATKSTANTAKATAHRVPIRLPGEIRDIGLSCIGATVLFTLDRRRRVQGRYRNTGFTVRLPDGKLADYERHLRISADADSMEWVRTAVRSVMSIALKEHGIQVTPHAIRLCTDRVDVALDDRDATKLSLALPPIFNEAGNSTTVSTRYDTQPYHWWSLPRSETVRTQLTNDPWYAQMRDLNTAFVTVGRDDEGIIMVDLGVVGSMGLDVDRRTSDCMLTSLAIELATAPWTIYDNILTAGLPQLNGFNRRIQEVESLPLIMPQLARIVSKRCREESNRSLNGRGNIYDYPEEHNYPKEHRHPEEHSYPKENSYPEEHSSINATYSDDQRNTIILVSSEQASKYRESCAALASLVGTGYDGLSAVIGDTVPNSRSMIRWTASENNGVLLMPHDHIVLNDIATITDEDMNSITALLNIAQDMEGEIPPEERLKPEHSNVNGQSGNIQVLPADDNRIEICLLGEVKVDGLQRPFTRAWALDLIAYLAAHAEGASSDQWATALWPDRLMAQSTLHSIASDARRALGVSTNGEEYLPKSHGRLALHPSVICDVYTLSSLAKSPNAADWRAGLEMVRGRPLQGLKSYDWALTDGTLAYLESEVVDLALKYAEYCLDRGDASGAGWAARKGLLVSQYDERLYRILMRSADMAGNPSGVDRVMRELIHLVAEDLEPYDSIHPDTIELYRSLSRHKATAVLV